jgi:hypothetical protein
MALKTNQTGTQTAILRGDELRAFGGEAVPRRTAFGTRGNQRLIASEPEDTRRPDRDLKIDARWSGESDRPLAARRTG